MQRILMALGLAGTLSAAALGAPLMGEETRDADAVWLARPQAVTGVKLRSEDKLLFADRPAGSTGAAVVTPVSKTGTRLGVEGVMLPTSAADTSPKRDVIARSEKCDWCRSARRTRSTDTPLILGSQY